MIDPTTHRERMLLPQSTSRSLELYEMLLQELTVRMTECHTVSPPTGSMTECHRCQNITYWLDDGMSQVSEHHLLARCRNVTGVRTSPTGSMSECHRCQNITYWLDVGMSQVSEHHLLARCRNVTGVRTSPTGSMSHGMSQVSEHHLLAQ